MRSVVVVNILASLSLALACAPVTSSRIGPPVSPKSENCDIEILTEGEVPNRPYRDVGVVSLSNCQDYMAGPCKNWLIKEACKLGGDVAYPAEDLKRDGRPDNLAGTITVSVTVGAYVNHVVPGDNDPVLNASPAEPCETSEMNLEAAEDPEAQMCTE